MSLRSSSGALTGCRMESELMMEGEAMPFDAKRMFYGGFEIAVDL